MIFIDVELSTNEHLVIHWADLNCVFIIVFFLPSVNLIALINNNKKVWRKFYFAYFIVLSWFELKLFFKSNDWVIFNSYRTHRFHLFLQQKKKTRNIYNVPILLIWHLQQANKHFFLHVEITFYVLIEMPTLDQS